MDKRINKNHGTRQREYKFEKVVLTQNDLPNDLQPIDDETHNQTKYLYWKEIELNAQAQVQLAKQHVNFYEKAIKSYNKAFKK